MAEIDSPHYLDLEISHALLKELTGVSFQSFTEIKTGWNNKALIVVDEQKRILRLSKPTWPKEKICNEVAALKFINESPLIFDYGFHPKAHWILMEFIEGDTLQECWPSLDVLTKRRVLLQLKIMIEKFQRFQFEKIGGWIQPNAPTLGPYFDGNFIYTNEKEFLLRMLEQNMSKLTIDTSVIEQLQPWISKTLDQLPPVPIVFFHGDVAFRNILFNRQSGKITLVDWEWAGSRPIYFDWLDDLYEGSREENEWIRKELLASGALVYDNIPGYAIRKLIADLVDSCAPWRFEISHSNGMANVQKVVESIRTRMALSDQN
jgi:tRNA A-37 threonylcarbamoyl transferase component Bud32